MKQVGIGQNCSSVSAADLVRHFGNWQDRARDQPIVVTRHGKNTHALLAYDKYLALVGPNDLHDGGDAIDRSIVAMFDEIPTAIFILSDDLAVLQVNRAARDLIRLGSGQVGLRPLAALFPETGNELIYRYLRRTVATGEHLSADTRLANSERWIHFQTMRVPAGVAIKMRDTTEDITARHIADVKEGMIAAMEADGSIGYARISVREMVERADRVLIEMLGISEDVFRRVKFSTVIPASHRASFTEALEQVFAGHGPVSIESLLFSRDGTQLPVRMSIVELRGDYASEGAIVVITRVVPASAGQC
ncbi:MAG TPA: PAS domain-containing protein [Sphingomonas sp.]|nr:PAS domain-containing protein [Sphingomonas sp.]